jgi:tetratricopeptide (TPR) repeat protein
VAKHNVVFALLLSFCLVFSTFAGTKTFTHEYTYAAGEADGKTTSRAIALDRVKRLLLDEFGAYLRDSLKVEKSDEMKASDSAFDKLTKEQITSLAAGATETKIIEEQWNGATFRIKAEITVDTEEVKDRLKEVANDRYKVTELEESQTRIDSANVEIERLRKELADEKSETGRAKIKKSYERNTTILTAEDWFQKGWNADGLKEYDSALSCYQKVVDLEPDNAEAYENMGRAYYLKRSYDKAIKLFQKAIDHKPGRASTYCSMAAAYHAKGNYNKAIELIQKAIDRKPDFAEAYIDMGYEYQMKGKYDKAIELCQKAVDIKPDFSEAYASMGDAYNSKGDNDKAIQCYQKAARLGNLDAQQYLRRKELAW